jgi:predicted small integral membrane protein
MDDLGFLGRLGRLVGTMYWTTPTAIFFSAILLMLATMTVWELASPTVERRGFLPMTTTRGDRLFIGLLGAAWIHLGWLGLTELPLWGGSIAALIWFVLVMRFG